MARVVYSSRALFNLDRLLDYLLERASDATRAADRIRDGVDILKRHPLIGRPCEMGLRELMISYGKTGYVALYSHEPLEDVIIILAIRHQREAGYAEDPWEGPPSVASSNRRKKP